MVILNLMKKTIILLVLAVGVGVIAQAPNRPWIRDIRWDGNAVLVEFGGMPMSEVVQIERMRNGFNDRRTIVALASLERGQFVGYPQFFRWRDTNDVVHGFAYTYRLRVVSGESKGPWSPAWELPPEPVIFPVLPLPGGLTGIDPFHETTIR